MKSIIVAFLLLIGASFCKAQSYDPVSWRFKSEKIAPLTYKVSIIATIKEPYHIYPKDAFDTGMGKPTEIHFRHDPNIELVGEIEQKGAEQKDEDELAFFDKGATFTQVVRLKEERSSVLDFTLKYMACTMKMCLSPAVKQYSLIVDQPGTIEAPDNATDMPEDVVKPVAYVYKDFIMPDVNGKQVVSRDITTKAKYTLIDFWASWCAPCRVQSRALIPLYDKYHGKGFSVLAVSLDTDAAAWKKAIRADGYMWENVSDLKGFKSDISKRYAITAIPRNILINDKGDIIATDLEGEELQKKIISLFE